VFKPVVEFRNDTGQFYKLQLQCRDCIKAYELKTRERRLKKLNARQRGEKRYWANLFGNSCVRCGYSEFDTALHFHHVNPEEKEATPTVIMKCGDKGRIYKELDKCALLCGNCHSSIEAGNWAATFVKSELGYIIKELK